MTIGDNSYADKSSCFRAILTFLSYFGMFSKLLVIFDFFSNCTPLTGGTIVYHSSKSLIAPAFIVTPVLVGQF